MQKPVLPEKHVMKAAQNKDRWKSELSIYGWSCVFGIFTSISLAIKYDEGLFVILKDNVPVKVKEEKIVDKIIYTCNKDITYQNWLLGKIWLDMSIINRTRFDNIQHFADEYARALGGLECALSL